MAKRKERKPDYIENEVFEKQDPVDGIDNIGVDTRSSGRPAKYLGFVTSTAGIDASVWDFVYIVWWIAMYLPTANGSWEITGYWRKLFYHA